jgi:hypothetical protein
MSVVGVRAEVIADSQDDRFCPKATSAEFLTAGTIPLMIGFLLPSVLGEADAE